MRCHFPSCCSLHIGSGRCLFCSHLIWSTACYVLKTWSWNCCLWEIHLWSIILSVLGFQWHYKTKSNYSPLLWSHSFEDDRQFQLELQFQKNLHCKGLTRKHKYNMITNFVMRPLGSRFAFSAYLCSTVRQLTDHSSIFRWKDIKWCYKKKLFMKKACITSDNNMLNLTIVVLRTRNGSNLEYMLPYRLQTNHYIH